MQTGAAEEFQSFIDQEEEEYLKKVLGRNLYDAFISGLDALPAAWVSTEAYSIGQQVTYGSDVWESLTDSNTNVTPIAGVDWTLIEANNRWLLLKNGNTYMVNGKYYNWDGMVKACKALIFSRWIELTAQSLTVNGYVNPKTENNIQVDPATFICRAWNDWSARVGSDSAPYGTLWGYLNYTNLAAGTFDDTFDSTFDSFVDYLAYEFSPQYTKNTFGL
jgi:hypothetical protein